MTIHLATWIIRTDLEVLVAAPVSLHDVRLLERLRSCLNSPQHETHSAHNSQP